MVHQSVSLDVLFLTLSLFISRRTSQCAVSSIPFIYLLVGDISRVTLKVSLIKIDQVKSLPVEVQRVQSRSTVSTNVQRCTQHVQMCTRQVPRNYSDDETPALPLRRSNSTRKTAITNDKFIAALSYKHAKTMYIYLRR